MKTPRTPPAHGGARPGAGRKPKAIEDATKDHHAAYTKARAEHEKHKAALAQLAFDTKTKKYIARDAVECAVATAFATIAQHIRSIPDNVERTACPGTEVIEAIESIIDETLNSLANELAAITEPADAG